MYGHVEKGNIIDNGNLPKSHYTSNIISLLFIQTIPLSFHYPP